MPGKESDLPSRKQRKVIGKNNVRGRMAGDLNGFTTTTDTQVAAVGAEKNPTFPKIDETTVTYGYVRDLER